MIRTITVPFRTHIRVNNFIHMFERPIRRKVNAYPKDFTPSPASRTVRSDTKHSHHQEFSFSGPKNHNKALNYSTQLEEDSKEELAHHIFTINPEDSHRHQQVEACREKPLINTHITRRIPFINPAMLSKARLEDCLDHELKVVGESDLESSMTPGKIHKNPQPQQNPLNIQQPAKIQFFNRELACNEKMDMAKTSIQQSFKSNLINASPRGNRLANLGRSGGSEAEGSFRTVKKNFSFSTNRRQSSSGSHLFVKQGVSEEKQPRQTLLGFGQLLESSRVRKLKNHIDQMAHEKAKSKMLVEETEPETGMSQFHARHNQKNKRKMKALAHTKFYPELGQSSFRDHKEQERQNLDDSYLEYLPTAPQSERRKYKISYKTSLNALKDIYLSLMQKNNAVLQVTVPNALLSLRIDPLLDKSSLYTQAVQIFEALGIPVHSPTVKRYSNCVLMLNKHICVFYRYNLKVYLGGWQSEYLDEGVKHGLGLEWVPNKYVYYGQFANNKKEGLGVMKTHEETFIGMWRQGSRTNEGLLFNKRGEMLDRASWKEPRASMGQSSHERDPFQ